MGGRGSRSDEEDDSSASEPRSRSPAGQEAAGAYQCAVIWMHGLGDTEAGWRSQILGAIKPKLSPQVGQCKFVFPRAPVQRVSCNGGQKMTSWFDMEDLPLGADDKPPTYGCSLEQAEASAVQVRGILDGLREEGIPSDRIVVGGFSQGGAMAMYTSLTYPHRLAACVAYSGILLGSDKLSDLATPEARSLPVLWCHGSEDDILEPSLQAVGAKALQALGLQVTTKQYRMGHSSAPQEFRDTSDFLNQVLAPTQPAAAEASATAAAAPEPLKP